MGPGAIKDEQKNGHPDFGGSWSHEHASKNSGSKKSECLQTSNRKIFNLIKILGQEVAIIMDPKT
jgi:hypothetical protein